MSYQPDDQELVGRHWPLDQVDELTESERVWLTAYWHEAHDFEDQAEDLLASLQPLDRVAVNELLDKWAVCWNGLCNWHHLKNYPRCNDDSNPVGKRLKYDSSMMGNLRGSLKTI